MPGEGQVPSVAAAAPGAAVSGAPGSAAAAALLSDGRWNCSQSLAHGTYTEKHMETCFNSVKDENKQNSSEYEYIKRYISKVLQKCNKRC